MSNDYFDPLAVLNRTADAAPEGPRDVNWDTYVEDVLNRTADGGGQLDDQRIRHAAALRHYRAQAEESWGPGSSNYLIERIPVAGAVTGIEYNLGLRDAARRLEKGEGTDADRDLLAQHQARQEYDEKRQKGMGFLGRAADLASHLPGMVAEWGLTGGAGTAARAAVGKAVASRVGEGLAGRLAAGAAGYAAEGAARSALMPSTYAGMAAQGVEQTPEGELKARDGLEAAGRGALASVIQNTIFAASGAFAPKEAGSWALDTAKSTAKAVGGAQLAKEAVYQALGSGRPSEIHELLAGPNRAEALEALAPELAVFGTLEAVMHAAPVMRARFEQLRSQGVKPESPAMKEALAATAEQLAQKPGGATVPPEAAPPEAQLRTPAQLTPEGAEATASAKPAEGPAAPAAEAVERRRDVALRKRVEEMTPDERAAAIEELRRERHTDPLTGLKNKVAYDEGERQPFQAFADADGLKQINDRFGHDAGNELLKAVGEAFKAEGFTDAIHFSGDEFGMEGASHADVEAKMRRVQERLANTELVFSDSKGKLYVKKGVGLTYGIAETLAAAEEGTKSVKAQREQEGKRELRSEWEARFKRDPGALPRGVSEHAPARRETGGDQARQAEAPAAKPGPARGDAGAPAREVGPYLSALEAEAVKERSDPAAARRKVDADLADPKKGIKAVLDFYDGSSALDRYARAYARERFGTAEAAPAGPPVQPRPADSGPTSIPPATQQGPQAPRTAPLTAEDLLSGRPGLKKKHDAIGAFVEALPLDPKLREGVRDTVDDAVERLRNMVSEDEAIDPSKFGAVVRLTKVRPEDIVERGDSRYDPGEYREGAAPVLTFMEGGRLMLRDGHHRWRAANRSRLALIDSVVVEPNESGVITFEYAPPDAPQAPRTAPGPQPGPDAAPARPEGPAGRPGAAKGLGGVEPESFVKAETLLDEADAGRKVSRDQINEVAKALGVKEWKAEEPRAAALERIRAAVDEIIGEQKGPPSAADPDVLAAIDAAGLPGVQAAALKRLAGGASLRQVGKEMGVSHEAVRQTALKGLAEIAKRQGGDAPHGLKDFQKRLGQIGAEEVAAAQPDVRAEFGRQDRHRGRPGVGEKVAREMEGEGRPLSAAEKAAVPGGGQDDAMPGAARETKPQTTALANEITDQERVKNGLDPILKPARLANAEVWDRAMARLDADPEAAAKLVEELTAKPRATTVEENALLLWQKVNLSNRYERAMRDVIAADAEKLKAMRGGGSAVEVEAARNRWGEALDKTDALLAKIDELDQATKKTGSEWGRAGQFRKQLAAEDYSLAGMMQRARAAKGEPLTPEEQQQVAALGEKIAGATKAADAAEEAMGGKGVGSPGYGAWVRASAEAEGAKVEFRQVVGRFRRQNKSLFDRLSDLLIKARQNMVISSPKTLAKIAAASAERVAFGLPEEAAGQFWSSLPGVRKIAEAAPREGRGLSRAAEARAFASSWSEGFRDAWQTLKKGGSELDLLHGGEDKVAGKGWLDLQFRLHAALKAPAVRAEYTRSLLKRVDAGAARGEDVTSPAALLRIQGEAYRDAQSAKFQQENWLVDAYNKWVANLRGPDRPWQSKALGVGARVVMPVVRIPTNLVFEIGTHAFGLGTGGIQAGLALARGVEKLKPAEADAIMRQLKKGSLGAAALMIGYALPEVFGGYYSGRRDDSDVEAGAARVGGVQLPSWAMHNPLLETIQLGATVRRASDKVYKGWRQGTAEGLMTGLAGWVEEIPFAHQATDAAKALSHDPKERGHYFGELAKSLAVPQLFQWVAGKVDSDERGEPVKRKPETTWEHVKTGVPGLRETVRRR